MNRLNIVLLIFMAVIYLLCIIKNIKTYRNNVPYGKTFIKKFYAKISDIDKALLVTNLPSFTTQAKNIPFTVTVRKDDVPKGLEYESIPLYKSYCVYIDNEAVCRAHILHVNCKDKVYLEFSSKRKYDEVIEIVNNAHTLAENMLTEYNKKWFGTGRRSFYGADNAKTEDMTE